MGDPTFDAIFNDLIDDRAEYRFFLKTLAEALPGAVLWLCPDAGAIMEASPSSVSGPPDGLEALAARSEQERGIVSARNDAGLCWNATRISWLKAALVFSLADGKTDLAALPGGEMLLLNSLELVRLRLEQGLLIADKEQALREISALKQQHGKLIEDNYRQYLLNQKREKEYARTLESEIARQTAELRQANVRLEEISRLKSDFLANMSHELRTPMNAIIGFAELLSETPLDNEQAEYAKTISQSAASLLAQVNDILDLAKIEAGKLELEHIPFPLADIVAGVTTMFRLVAREKGVELSCRIDGRLPPLLVGDGNRLRQILVNLVGNALKFTEQGRIVMAVERVPGEKGRVVGRFSVQDTGIGIPADRVEAIFDKFTQADSSTTRRYGGTGLGLAICRQLVELMGGRLMVESEPGRGSVFSFLLPLDEARAEGVSADRGKDVASSLQKAARVLLVEDNIVNQRLATILVQREGLEVKVAANGIVALECLRQEIFDLVLMDVQMPGMDGMEATRKIREIEEDPAVCREYAGLRDRPHPLPIVGLTAHSRKEDEEACYKAGMNGFLVKPIVKTKLVRILAEMLPEGCGEE